MRNVMIYIVLWTSINTIRSIKRSKGNKHVI